MLGNGRTPAAGASRTPLTCLVTGGTSGVGEAIATRLAGDGHRVLITARTPERGDAAVARIRRTAPAAHVAARTVDLAVVDDVRTLAAGIRDTCPRLDVLILNAAVARPRREFTPDGLEKDFATNHLSPFLLTADLLPLLTASSPARVIVATSTAYQHVNRVELADLPTGRNFHHILTYAATKLLNVWFTTELARRLAGTGVTCYAADPRFTRTALGRDAPPIEQVFLRLARLCQRTPARGAETAVHLATEPALDLASGSYVRGGKVHRLGALAADSEMATRSWDLSREVLSERGSLPGSG